jgi:transposase
VSLHAAPVTLSTVVGAVDVGKCSVALSVTDARRHRPFGSVEFAMTKSALTCVVGQVRGVLAEPETPVKVGVAGAGIITGRCLHGPRGRGCGTCWS